MSKLQQNYIFLTDDLNAVPSTISAREMRIGQIGVITTNEYAGRWLLRAYDRWVSLDQPNSTWSDPGPQFRVRLLRHGERLILEGKNSE